MRVEIKLTVQPQRLGQGRNFYCRRALCDVYFASTKEELLSEPPLSTWALVDTGSHFGVMPMGLIRQVSDRRSADRVLVPPSSDEGLRFLQGLCGDPVPCSLWNVFVWVHDTKMKNWKKLTLQVKVPEDPEAMPRCILGFAGFLEKGRSVINFARLPGLIPVAHIDL